MDSLERRMRELDRQVSIWNRIEEPQDADRNAFERLAVRVWRAGLLQVLIGIAIAAAALLVLPWTGFSLVSLDDARLARFIRSNVPEANHLAQDDLLARVRLGRDALQFVSEVITDPVPADTLSWIGRLTSTTPPLVRGDRLVALRDLVRLLGDAPQDERLARLDWLVTLALEARDPNSDFGHVLQMLSQFPLDARKELIADQGARLRTILWHLRSGSTATRSLAALEKELADSLAELERKIAERRRGIADAGSRSIAEAAVGKTCAPQWRRFEACTQTVLNRPSASRSTPGEAR